MHRYVIDGAQIGAPNSMAEVTGSELILGETIGIGGIDYEVARIDPEQPHRIRGVEMPAQLVHLIPVAKIVTA